MLNHYVRDLIKIIPSQMKMTMKISERSLLKPEKNIQERELKKSKMSSRKSKNSAMLMQQKN